MSACQNGGAASPPASAPPDETSASEDYPILQTVPPRPQLSYTVQQQREIVEALIADRENARYTDQVVRHRSGLSSLPPPPAPPVPAVAPGAGPVGSTPSQDRPDSTAETATAEDVLGEDTFAGFLRALSRHFDSDDPEPAAPEATTPDAGAVQGSTTVPEPPEGATTEPTGEPRPPANTAATAQRDVIPQTSAPLPPPQTAVSARQTAAEETGSAHVVPIPVPHPERAAFAGTGPVEPPQPPPVKPQIEALLEAPVARRVTTTNL